MSLEVESRSYSSIYKTFSIPIETITLAQQEQGNRVQARINGLSYLLIQAKAFISAWITYFLLSSLLFQNDDDIFCFGFNPL